MPHASPSTYVQAHIEQESPPSPSFALSPSVEGALPPCETTWGGNGWEQCPTGDAKAFSHAPDGALVFPGAVEVDATVKHRVHTLLKMLAGEFEKLEAELASARGEKNGAGPRNGNFRAPFPPSVKCAYGVQAKKKTTVDDEPSSGVHEDILVDLDSHDSGVVSAVPPATNGGEEKVGKRRKSTFVTQSRGFGPDNGGSDSILDPEDQPVREAMNRAIQKLYNRTSAPEVRRQSSGNNISDAVPSAYKSSIGNAFRDFKRRAASVASFASHGDHWADTKMRFACAETIMSIIIVANCIAIGISSDVARGSPGWFYVDCFFLFAFSVERVCRFMGQGCSTYWFGPDWKWNVFEFALVVIGYVELSVDIQVQLSASPSEPTTVQLLRAARLVRLVKIMRIFRLEVFCDLLMMVDGLRYGAKTLLASIILISIPLYVLALIFRETIGTDDGQPDTSPMFSNVVVSFFTMFRCIIIGDCAQADGKPVFHLVTQAHGWMFGIVYVGAAFTMTFGLFNVIVSVYVENTLAKVKYNELVRKRQRLEDQERLAEKTSEVIEHVWRCAQVSECTQFRRFVNFSDFLLFEISPVFFKELLSQQKFRDLLRELDVNDDDQMDLFDTLDVDGNGALSVEELVIGIIRLRGDARRADVIAVGLMVRNLQSVLRLQDAALRQIKNDVSHVSKALGSVSALSWPTL